MLIGIQENNQIEDTQETQNLSLLASARMSDVDVLVVGAGPVGMLAALEIVRHGVPPDRVRVVDAAAKPARYAKASSLWHRTMELLQYSYPDVWADMEARSTARPVVSVYKAEKVGITKTADLNANTLNLDALMYCEHAAMRTQEQYSTEEHLRSEMERSGVDIERGVALANFQDVGAHVVVELSHKKSGHLERVNARYLIGADGGASTVRKGLGLDFQGEQIKKDWWFVSHCRVPNMPAGMRDEAWVVVHEKGLVMGIPMPEDTYEMVVSCLPDTEGKPKFGNPPRLPTMEELSEILNERVPGVDLTCSDPQWTSFFHPNSRQVPKYLVGRVFLMGDACHVHSPLGGQGMNYGMQDAVNLGWKMAAVLRGDASSSLLNSYHAERHPAGKVLVSLTDTSTKAILNLCHSSSTVRSTVMALQKSVLASGEPSTTVVGMKQFAMATLAQLNIHYKDSPICLEHWVLQPLQLSLSRMLHRHQVARTWLFRKRLVAGQRAPNVELEAALDNGSSRLHALIHSTAKLTVLLFEAAPGWEDTKVWRGGQDVDLRQAAWELEVLGDGLLQCKIMGPGEEEARKAFGVWGQCAFVIRPDGYIAFRSQPVSRTAISKFLVYSLGLKRMGKMDTMDDPQQHDPPQLAVSGLAINNGLLALTSVLLAGNLIAMYYSRRA